MSGGKGYVENTKDASNDHVIVPVIGKDIMDHGIEVFLIVADRQTTPPFIQEIQFRIEARANPGG